jgi:hypothetical protein
MINKSRRFRLKYILISLVCIPIASCFSPPAPQPWFNQAISIKDDDYPQGVDFDVLRDGGIGCFSDSIIVTNNSSIPLYIPVTSLWSRPNMDLEDLDEPCPNTNFCLKVVSNKAWVWTIINRDESPPWDYGWVPVNMFGDSEYLEIYVGGSYIHTSRYEIQSIDLLNKYDDGSERPEDLNPPSPQVFDLFYLYGDQALSTTFTVTYSINECYEEVKTIDPYKYLLKCFIAIIIAFVAVFALLFNSLIKRIERNARSRDY